MVRSLWLLGFVLLLIVCVKLIYFPQQPSEWTDGEIDIQRDNHADECKVENENSCGKNKKCD